MISNCEDAVWAHVDGYALGRVHGEYAGLLNMLDDLYEMAGHDD